MRTARFLLPGIMVALGVGSASAQPRPGVPAGGYPSFVPSVLPANANEPPPTAPTGPGWAAPPGAGAVPDPVGRLTAAQAAPTALPPGSYPSPYFTDGPGCCGPLGRDGRVGYEVYSYAGVNFTIGNGLPDLLKAAGWTVGGGIRTLLFDATHTSAWTFDFGGSYTYNRGLAPQEPRELFLRSQPQQAQNGTVVPVPDRFELAAVRGIHRSSFNYAFGRDVWLLGDGSTGGMSGTNWRVGGWVGGRYGTSHVDLVPLNEINGYSRRQNVFHGIYFGLHTTCDVPMGAWVWTNGIRFEYGHDWTNLVPPLQGNLHNINLQFTTGIRF